jgi:hypothetical protein
VEDRQCQSADSLLFSVTEDSYRLLDLKYSFCDFGTGNL